MKNAVCSLFWLKASNYEQNEKFVIYCTLILISITKEKKLTVRKIYLDELIILSINNSNFHKYET